jgi:DNA-binding PadR family transcriptional regulator
MDLQQLSEKIFPKTEIEIGGKIYPYTPDLQRDGFIKGYQEALQNIYNVEQLKECYKDAQEEMRKCFSSSYVSKTFEQWIEEKFKIKL